MAPGRLAPFPGRPGGAVPGRPLDPRWVRPAQAGVLDFVTFENSPGGRPGPDEDRDRRTDQVRGRLAAVLLANGVAAAAAEAADQPRRRHSSRFVPTRRGTVVTVTAQLGHPRTHHRWSAAGHLDGLRASGSHPSTATMAQVAYRLDPDLVQVVSPDAVPENAAVLAVLVLSTPSTRPAASVQDNDGARGHSGWRLEAGPGLVLDLAARVVVMDGAELELTRREFDLFHQLASRPGVVHSRDHLVQTVWASADPRLGPQRTVDVHVARLRRKLGPAHRGLLQTVRGVGYRWSRRPLTVTVEG